MTEKVKVYSDGGARGNPGPAAIGALVTDEKGNILAERGECIGEATNNIAEYTAVLVGLELAKSVGAKEIKYFTDSLLVANQLSGKYRVKTPHIISLHKQATAQMRLFSKVVFTHLPREHEMIRHVDALVNEALDQES